MLKLKNVKISFIVFAVCNKCSIFAKKLEIVDFLHDLNLRQNVKQC